MALSLPGPMAPNSVNSCDGGICTYTDAAVPGGSVIPGSRKTTMWLKAGVGGMRNAYWASVIAWGEALMGRPEMMMPKGMVDILN